jgi:hypothetical protein
MTLDEKIKTFENNLEHIENKYPNYFKNMKEDIGTQFRIKGNIITDYGERGNLEIFCDKINVPKFIKDEIVDAFFSIFSTSQDSH